MMKLGEIIKLLKLKLTIHLLIYDYRKADYLCYYYDCRILEWKGVWVYRNILIS